MKSINRFTSRYPIFFAIFVLILIVILTEATEIPLYAGFQKFFDLQTSYYLTEILLQGLCAVILGIYLARVGILRNAGLTKPKSLKELWLVWPILVLAAVNGWSLLDGSICIDTSNPRILLLFVLIALSTGFYEEILCRGLILSACLKKWGSSKKGIYLSVLIFSLIFGLPFHFANFIMNRGTWLEVSTQMIYAVFYGVFFAACFLRFGSLWPAIITHTIFDMMGTISEVAVGNEFVNHFMSTNTSLTNALMTILITLPLFIYGLFILRKVVSKPPTA